MKRSFAILPATSRLLGLIVMVVFLFMGYSSHSETYSVHGHIRYEGVVHTNSFWEYDFKVAVSNCIWAIDLEMTAKSPSLTKPKDIPGIVSFGPESDSPRKFRQVFNGKELTSTTYAPHPLYYTNAGVVNESEGVLVLENNDVPDASDGGVAATLWLAYASKCYLDQNTNGRLKPISWLQPNMRLSGFTTPAKIARYSQGKGLPLTVDYYFDEAAWNASASAKAPTRSKAGTGDDLSSPILSSEYLAPDFTNAFGIGVPTTFELTGFEAFHELVNPGKRLAVCKITGVTYSLTEAIDNRLFDPHFDGYATVEDRRLMKDQNSASISYIITNSAPRSVDDKDLMLMQSRADRVKTLSERYSRENPQNIKGGNPK